MARRSRTEAPQSEAAFLAAYDVTKFPRPSVAVDVALLSVHQGGLYAVVVERVEHPAKGEGALPGGFVRLEESLDDAASRVLAEKAKLRGVFLEQLYTFGHPRRDPRTRVISVAYYALVEQERLRAAAEEAPGISVVRLAIPWEGETGGAVRIAGTGKARRALAFDHAEILGMAVKRIRGKLDYSPVGFQLLPERFTLLQLQEVHETVMGRPFNKDSFRRRMLASGQLEATGDLESGVGHRPAEIYRFRRRAAV